MPAEIPPHRSGPGGNPGHMAAVAMHIRGDRILISNDIFRGSAQILPGNDSAREVRMAPVNAGVHDGDGLIGAPLKPRGNDPGRTSSDLLSAVVERGLAGQVLIHEAHPRQSGDGACHPLDPRSLRPADMHDVRHLAPASGNRQT